MTCHIPSTIAEENAVVEMHEAGSCNSDENIHRELVLLGEASSWLASLFSTREHWYRWFASFLNPEYHGRLWGLTHLSICNIDQIEFMLASLLTYEYDRVGRFKRVAEFPERNTDWALTYANALLPVPIRYHVISQKRLPDRIIWGILFNLAAMLLRYHEQAGFASAASKALCQAFKKARRRFPDISPYHFTPWPQDIGARLAAYDLNPEKKMLVQELLQIQQKWHQRLTGQDLEKLLKDMLGFVKTFDIRDGKGKTVFHLFEMITTVTVIRAAVNTGWEISSLVTEWGRHPKAILKRSCNGQISRCEISKETSSTRDRSTGLKKFLNVDSPGFMPDIVLRFWRDAKTVEPEPDFWAFADAKRNEVTSSYISTSIDKAITYAASLGYNDALNLYTSDFQACASYPFVSLFFYSASHRDYRDVITQKDDDGKHIPLVLLFNIDDMRAAFDSSAINTQLHVWFDWFNQYLDSRFPL